MNTLELNQLVAQKQWPILIQQYSHEQLCAILSFEESLRLSYELFHKNMFDDAAQQYAVELAKTIRKNFPHEWNADWKLDVF